MTFLLVDDAKISRSYIKNAIQEIRGKQDTYLEAENGKIGIEILTKEKVDAMFVDIHMPELDGISFLKIVKSQESTKVIPVVVVTTDSEESRVKEVISAGAMDYMVKPPDIEKLKVVLSKFT